MLIKYDTHSEKLPLIRKKSGIRTISEMFYTKTREYSDLDSFYHIKKDEIVKFTYREVFENVVRIAAYLKDLGLKKGDHVAIISENRPEWAISYFSLLWLGCVAVPLDAKAHYDSLEHIIKFSGSNAVFFSGSHLKDINSISETAPDLIHLIQMENFSEITSNYDSGIECVEVQGDDLSEILFTSGTTDNPKGIMLTHRNIMSNVEDVYGFLDIHPGDRAFSVLPIHHSYEKTGGLLSTFYSGITVYYGRGLKPRELLEDLKYVEPTIWINTPLLLEKIISRIKRELSSQKGLKKIALKLMPKSLVAKSIKKKLGLDQLRLLVSGGAALPDWVFEGFRDLGITIIQGYGLSEASPIISANPLSNPRKGSVGKVIESDEVRILDTDNENIGEIVIKGPNVMKGYYRNEEETSCILSEDGWLRTGDLGYFDKDGYLYITGRKKFVIVTSGGKNIFPEEIEEKLTRSPLIEETLVFSPDDRVIQAVIFPNIEEYKMISSNKFANIKDKELYDMVESEVRNLNRELEPHKRISKFAIKTEEFPKTTTRKIKRYLFKDLDLDKSKTYL